MIWWIIATCAAFFVKGLCGFTNGLVFTTILSFTTDNVNISPVSLVIGYPTNFIMAWKNRKSINWKMCAVLTTLVILGNIPGAFLLKNADSGFIKVILGFIIIYLSVEMYLNEKRKTKKKSSKLALGTVGLLAGLIAGVYGVGALLGVYVNKITNENIQAAFYMSPEEIVEYFKSKGVKVSYDWHDVYNEAHAHAFTVAKMTELDLLKDTQNLLAKSIEDGMTYLEFKKEAMNLFASKGWVGFKEVTNPKTGEKETVELGTPRRIRNIYINNINSAYAAGKYKELMEEVDVAPYWQYQCMMDGRERPEHAALHGKVFKADDPFWQNFYPPNGWGCRCWVVNLTQNQVDKQGLKVEKTEGKITSVTEQVGENEVETPVYTFDDLGKTYSLKPDAGWSYNPATECWGIDVQAWKKVDFLNGKKDLFKGKELEKAQEIIRNSFISKMAENPHRHKYILNMIENSLRNNLKSEQITTALTWFTPKILESVKKYKLKIQNPIVVMPDTKIYHAIGSRKADKQKVNIIQLKNIYNIVNKPDEILLDIQDERVVYIRYLKNTEIIDKRDCIYVPVSIKNQKSKINYVTTMGRVKYSDAFKDKKRYKKIE